MIRFCLFFFALLSLAITCSIAQSAEEPSVKIFTADNKYIQYTGRIDFTNSKKPRFWLPGVYITAKFVGESITVLLNDENLGGNNLNYLEIIVDDQQPYRIQTTGKSNEIIVGENLKPGSHIITICKNTETNIGYLEFIGFKCRKLLRPAPKPKRKLEFIGNSITCGTGVDLSTIPCGKGKWHDQHNAYMSYGPLVARALNAQWHLTAYSGIGLTRSCCNLPMTMPDVFNMVNMKDKTTPWDFNSYQPDAVTICLGQNDGIQDSTKFCSAYVKFIQYLRSHYPKSKIICLTSPMADAKLAAAQKNYLTGITAYMNNNNDKDVYKFFFSRGWNSGCDSHPDMNDHKMIAEELKSFLKSKLGWN